MTPYVQSCLESGARIADTKRERGLIGVHVCPKCLDERMHTWHFENNDNDLIALCQCGEELTSILTFQPQKQVYIEGLGRLIR